MTERQRKITYEGELVAVEHGRLDVHAGNGVRPVEHIKRNVRLGSIFHGIRHGGNVRIEPRAHVLNVEYQRVETGQHLGR